MSRPIAALFVLFAFVPSPRVDAQKPAPPPPSALESLDRYNQAVDSGAQVSLAWILQRPTVASAIIGGRTEEQFADSLKAATLALAPDQVARLDAVSQPPLPYPYWHQSFTVGDRMGEADLLLHASYLGKPLGTEEDKPR
jgi:hypothetical protein